ncbi:MAG: hypothetical protein Q8R60_00530 [Mycobacteriales bacterium]|nr:hypothetical protein [Mycobacteriales bacterium]
MTEIRLVPPPADGLAQAFREAAARRRRKAATTGSAGLLGAAIVFATLTGGSGQVLTQDDPLPPAQQDRNVLELLPVGPTPAASAPGTSGPRRSATTAAGSAGGPTATAATLTPGAPRSTAVPVRPATRPTTTAYRAAPMSRRTSDAQQGNVPALTCSSIGGNNLCSSVATTGSGKDRLLSVVLCNQGVDAIRLDFSFADELDIEVAQGDRVLWRWAVGRSAVRDPHQARLPASGCRDWTTPWTAVDQSGRPLATGMTYDLRARIDSPDAAEAAAPTGYYYS